jgi:hypothetical protein
MSLCVEMSDIHQILASKSIPRIFVKIHRHVTILVKIEKNEQTLYITTDVYVFMNLWLLVL